jgi:hypothetical protein
LIDSRSFREGFGFHRIKGATKLLTSIAPMDSDDLGPILLAGCRYKRRI